MLCLLIVGHLEDHLDVLVATRVVLEELSCAAHHHRVFKEGLREANPEVLMFCSLFIILLIPADLFLSTVGPLNIGVIQNPRKLRTVVADILLTKRVYLIVKAVPILLLLMKQLRLLKIKSVKL